MLQIVVFTNLVKHSFHPLTHLLKTLQQDGIWHFIFLSFILVQNEFDTVPDYCGKKKQKPKKQEKTVFSFWAQSFIKIGEMALYLKVMLFLAYCKTCACSFTNPYFPVTDLKAGTHFPARWTCLIWIMVPIFSPVCKSIKNQALCIAGGSIFH